MFRTATIARVAKAAKTGVRWNSTGTPFRVAVIGSGPAGFYTSLRLLEKLPGTKVDMYEALPVPFGLARFGVAPDHPEVKNCQDRFAEVAESPDFNYYGNVPIGSAGGTTIKALRENYNSIVFAYGSSTDRELGIKGEQLPGVWSARQFVGWYNGLPLLTELDPPLEDVEDVLIVGNGNVALDVARILLTDVSRLKSTDITEQAYEKLKKSRVKNVRITARRGLLQSAFATKEVRELIQEKNATMEPLDQHYLDHYRPFESLLTRRLKRLIQVLESAEKEAKKKTTGKSWRLDYLQSPLEFYSNPANSKLISAARFELNNLIQEDIESPARCIGTGDTVVHKAELAFRSIGYKAVAIPGMSDIGLEFDPQRGVIPSEFGRAIQSNGRYLPGCYVAGWVKTGPTGVIAQTMRESFEVAETIIEDYYMNKLDKMHKPGFDGVKDSISNKVVTWDAWKKIEQFENDQGSKIGKPRRKIVNTEEMLSHV
ncbi:probable NADPH:adrenodoxin oxidoreductase, mitochondrial [Trichomonascus vanleenenianus]|uniref:NADPH-adrenodoxin reductase n=1 Tax=Trichomonascus vanleenenianus TaxID=2268995 RepID=UPI003ECA713F